MQRKKHALVMAASIKLSLFTCLAALLAALAAACTPFEDSPAPSVSCIVRLSTKAGVVPKGISHIDAFVFNDDSKRLLDSYTRLGTPEGDSIEVSSTSGRKIIVLVANADSSLFTYGSTNSYANFCKICQDFSRENPRHPVLSGECTVQVTGPGVNHDICLSPLLARIKVKLFSVDFSSRPYSGKDLTDIRAYLININSGCTLLPLEEERTLGVMNHGKLVPSDVSSLDHPEMVVCEDAPTEAVFYCFPGIRREGELGQCATRLVVEGKVGNSVWYYPVNIGEDGVRRGVQYNVYITITRLGTTDPDIEAKVETISVDTGNIAWNEYDEEDIHY